MIRDEILPSGNIVNVLQIGQLIKNKRKELGITQKDAASMCNIGTRFFSELERGKKTLQIGLVLKVLQDFGFVLDIVERHEK
ncbi:MAG: helix-turn-helix domain-containing protein [Pseudomonadota bacterium]